MNWRHYCDGSEYLAVDRLKGKGNKTNPNFCCQWNPFYFININPICKSFIFSRFFLLSKINTKNSELNCVRCWTLTIVHSITFHWKFSCSHRIKDQINLFRLFRRFRALIKLCCIYIVIYFRTWYIAETEKVRSAIVKHCWLIFYAIRNAQFIWCGICIIHHFKS